MSRTYLTLPALGGGEAILSGDIQPLPTRPYDEPVADAGGPYVGSPGVETVFDGSGSRASAGIASYLWDFGDNSSGQGSKLGHIYEEAGVYRVTLIVVDFAGRTAVDSRLVDVSPQMLYVYVDVFPEKDSYYFGDSLSSVEASVAYANGSEVVGASVTGYLEGRRTVPVSFSDAGGGKYHGVLDYPIEDSEEDFIDIHVNATDSVGRTGVGLRKLVVASPGQEMQIAVEKPSGKVYAYGQEVEFRARMIGAQGENIENGNLSFHETWSDQKFRFSRQGDEYVFNYTMPQNIGERALLILYATFVSGGKKYKAVKEIDLRLSHDLTVKVEGISQAGELLMKVNYPDGSDLPYQMLKADAGNVSFFLQNRQGFFVGTFPQSSSKFYVWVSDVYGNGGGSEVVLAADKGMAWLSGPWVVLILGVGVIIFAVAFVMHLRKKSRRDKLMAQYEDSKTTIIAIEKLKKKMLQDYYSRRITEEEVRRSIFECDKLLIDERAKLKDVMSRLGMKYDESEGKTKEESAEGGKEEPA